MGDEGRCFDVRRLGESCENAAFVACEYEYACQDGVCAGVPEGAPCSHGRQCDLGLRCDFTEGRCTSEPVATPPTYDIGDTCETDCGGGIANLLGCVPNDTDIGECRKIDVVELGEPCDGLFIIDFPGPYGRGQRWCRNTFTTVSCSLSGNDTERRCALRSDIGEACDSDQNCRLGTHCVDGTCQDLAFHGEPCDPQAGCYQSTCVDGICQHDPLPACFE